MNRRQFIQSLAVAALASQVPLLAPGPSDKNYTNYNELFDHDAIQKVMQEVYWDMMVFGSAKMLIEYDDKLKLTAVR